MRSRPQLVRSLSLSFFVALVFASGAFAEAPIPIDYDYGDSALSLSALGAENPVEFQGRLTRPATMDGVHPIVVLLHGRHSTCEGPFGETLRWPCAGSEQPTPSHLGYDYLAEALANKGIVVISISANGINAMDNYVEDGGAMARAELIQEHLKLLERANTGSVEPFGDALVGHLDLTRVGTMGHSRGGEGVVQHYLYNKQLGEPFGIKAVLPLAPVSFGSLTPAGVPLAVTLGYCDGDVYTLDGVHYFDRIRPNASDSAPKHLVVLYGGNHNFFNTVWSPTTYGPGAMDDWEIMETYVGKDAHCSASSAQNGRLTEEEQQDTLAETATAFYGTYLLGEPTPGILTGDDPLASGTRGAPVRVTYEASITASKWIHHFATSDSVGANDLGGNQLGKLVSYTVCGDLGAGLPGCISDQGSFLGPDSLEPHSSLGQMECSFDAGNYVGEELPVADQDWTGFAALQFRASMDFDSTDAENIDFDIVVRDRAGAAATVRLSDFSDALTRPPGKLRGVLPRAMLNGVRIPLDAFTGVDLSRVQYVWFAFDTPGAILLADLTLAP